MKKYTREILIGLLFILNIVTIFLLIQQTRRTNEALEISKEIAAENKKQLEENIKILARNQVVLDSMMTIVAENDKTIVLDKQEYEKVKKSPRRTNYTDKELINWLNSYRSNHKR